MDQFDQASDLEDLARDIAIRNAKKSKAVIKPTGYCLQCEEELEGNVRWCSNSCRDDWQKWNKGS